MYQEEADTILESFMQSKRQGDYFNLAPAHYCEAWNKCMTSPDPGQTWGGLLVCGIGNQSMMWSDTQVERHHKMAQVSGVDYTDSGSLRYVFMEIDCIFCQCFENAINLERKRR